MSQAQAVAETDDRLPWLADETTPASERGGNGYLWAIVAALALIAAAAAYFFGSNLIEKFPSQPPAAQVPQPPAEPAVEQPQQRAAQLPPAPVAAPMPAREAPIARHRHAVRTAHHKPAASPTQETATATAEESQASGTQTASAPAKHEKLKLWPATESQGAAGRIVRIGSFGSRFQAKLGWRYMVRSYPAVAHLPATVVLAHNSQGRPFYRFQIGTTSQAHSEVLCQRMDRIHLSCAVVGLAWKPTGVER
jgi:hypothetical protein